MKVLQELYGGYMDVTWTFLGGLCKGYTGLHELYHPDPWDDRLGLG